MDSVTPAQPPASPGPDRADSALAADLALLPTLPPEYLGIELRMTRASAASVDAPPCYAAYLSAIREEIARRGLTEADAIAAMEERFAARRRATPTPVTLAEDPGHPLGEALAKAADLAQDADGEDPWACDRCGKPFGPHHLPHARVGHNGDRHLFACAGCAPPPARPPGALTPETAFYVGFASGIRYTQDNPGDHGKRAGDALEEHLTAREQAALSRAITAIMNRRTQPAAGIEDAANRLARIDPAELDGTTLEITGMELLTLASSVSAIRPAIREGDAGHLLDVLDDAYRALAGIAERRLAAAQSGGEGR